MMRSAVGVQMFMEKLNQLIHRNDSLEIIYGRPQFQLLYDELGSMIQTLFIDQHQDLPERVCDLRKRFICAAEEAEYFVDLYLSGIYEGSVNLGEVRRSFDSIKVEFMSMRLDNMKTDSSRRTLNQSAAAPRSSRGSSRLDEIIVGIDDDAELIRDKLVEDQKKLDVVSIVGMGGLGKTTLATKVFNDDFVRYHFAVRVWVTVSQTYDKRGVLIQILESIRGQLHLSNAPDNRLRELVHKNLMGKRYLIVIDDIWSIETWDQVRLLFPHDNTRSRILVTSRLVEVAKHATSDGGLIHHLGYLSKERSWEFLRKKVFGDNDNINKCPEWSIKSGMQIVQICKGLPLSVGVIAGILAKEAWSEEWWEEVAERTSSYIVGDQSGCLEILAFSYHQLPLHLRECFLYLGGFPEDHKFDVEKLIWLWMAEGFIQQDGSKSLEDIAKSYLMDLIDRNLVIVSNRRKYDGVVKGCTLHDLVRELCLGKAQEEGFILQIQSRKVLSSQFSNVTTSPYKPVRMFINKGNNFLFPAAQNLRSVLFFQGVWWDDIDEYFHSFRLLRVLDLQTFHLNNFFNDMELLVHLRYLAIRYQVNIVTDFPSSICKLWRLQTLIYHSGMSNPDEYILLPKNISDLVNLRHLRTNKYKIFYLPSIEKPMKNLQTISNVRVGVEVGNFQNCFPYIKTLECTSHRYENCDFQSLICLEKLILIDEYMIEENCITLPATLRELTLVYTGLPLSYMSFLQSLPNLEVLKLKGRSFKGHCWNTDGQEFRKLKFLSLWSVGIERWEAYSKSFPCLQQLKISNTDLDEIPLEIGNIPTLKLIKLFNCKDSLNESVQKIQEEQNDFGNYDLKIDIGPSMSEKFKKSQLILETMT